jgi:hypothetical protein
MLEMRGNLLWWYSWVGSNHRPPVPQTDDLLMVVQMKAFTVIQYGTQ